MPAEGTSLSHDAVVNRLLITPDVQGSTITQAKTTQIIKRDSNIIFKPFSSSHTKSLLRTHKHIDSSDLYFLFLLMPPLWWRAMGVVYKIIRRQRVAQEEKLEKPRATRSLN